MKNKTIDFVNQNEWKHATNVFPFEKWTGIGGCKLCMSTSQKRVSTNGGFFLTTALYISFFVIIFQLLHVKYEWNENNIN